jgi:hypothetical protein
MSTRHERRRSRANDLILQEGKAAILRRLSTDGDEDRQVTVFEDAFSTREIDGVTVLQGDRRYIVSALSPADGAPIAPPNEQTEILVIPDPDDDSLSTELRIASPPSRFSPGPIVIYYELHCRDR